MEAQPSPEPTPPPAAVAPAAGAVPDPASGTGDQSSARRPAAWRQPALWVGLLALALVGWQAFDAQQRARALQEQLASRLAAGDAANTESRLIVRQNQEAVLAAQARLGALEAALAESRSQQAALDALVQELTRNRDERLLAEVDLALSAALQQLQLSGNVEGALLALQSAETQLAASGRAQFLPLRKVIGRDIERLRALPMADLSGIALRLDTILRNIDTMPLDFETTPQLVPEPAAAVAQGRLTPTYWKRLLGELWDELKSLVRIERLDRPAPALLSPSHAFFLRENLKLRLINARLSLLQHDGKAFQQDIVLAREWVERYFDRRARSVQAALAALHQLAAVEVGAELPDLQDSLTTLRNIQVIREREHLVAGERNAPGGRP